MTRLHLNHPIDDVNGVISEFKSKDPSVIIGLGGGSSMVF